LEIIYIYYIFQKVFFPIFYLMSVLNFSSKHSLLHIWVQFCITWSWFLTFSLEKFYSSLITIGSYWNARLILEIQPDFDSSYSSGLIFSVFHIYTKLKKLNYLSIYKHLIFNSLLCLWIDLFKGILPVEILQNLADISAPLSGLSHKTSLIFNAPYVVNYFTLQAHNL
jgi:hypothetical protein